MSPGGSGPSLPDSAWRPLYLEVGEVEEAGGEDKPKSGRHRVDPAPPLPDSAWRPLDLEVGEVEETEALEDNDARWTRGRRPLSTC